MIKRIKKEVEKRYKKQIFYTRTYRHLSINKKTCFIYFLFIVIPALFALLLSYSGITELVSNKVTEILQIYIGADAVEVSSQDFLPIFGKFYYVVIPTIFPTEKMLLYSLIVTAILMLICMFSRGKGRPLCIFFVITLGIHLVSCIFLLLRPEDFPYTGSDYSRLYMSQQVGIWIAFLVISGIITGLLGTGRIFGRLVTFLGIMTYSFVFGIVRYLVFMYFISKFSIAYMAVLFFSFGPFFDFLYLVFLYGIYVNRMIAFFDTGKGRRMWKWS